MQGDSAIIEKLNEILTAELTAINQYFINSKMCANWGYERLAKHHWDESIEEMKHADKVIERLLFLEGVPNMQKLDPVRVGEDAIEQHRCNLALELEQQRRYNEGVALCREKGDNGTRKLLEELLREEEEGIDWIEAQLGLVEEVGKENYLAEQMHA